MPLSIVSSVGSAAGWTQLQPFLTLKFLGSRTNRVGNARALVDVNVMWIMCYALS
jgi:hypothetical protein